MPTPPIQVYKYMRREHAEQLVNQGQIRIGTLLDFQNLDRHGSEIGDAQEGQRTTIVHGDEREAFHIDNLQVFGSTFQNVTSTGSGGPAITIVERSEQYYILCFALEANAEAMRRMGYDTCVRIYYPMEFCRRLTRAMTGIGRIQVE